MSDTEERANADAPGLDHRSVSEVVGLLLTVGRVAGPLLHAIAHYAPRHVAFLSTRESAGVVDQVLAGLPRSSAGITHERFTCDSEDMSSAYDASTKALRWLRDAKRLAAGQIRIDPTGGTKPMSAAAILAAAPERILFSYIGGARSHGGLGTVESGSEVVVELANPWAELEELDQRRFCAYLDGGEWRAAAQLATELDQRPRRSGARPFKELRGLAEGLECWDRFDHRRALREKWKKGQLPAKLASDAAAFDHIRRAAQIAATHVPWLEAVVACEREVASPDAPDQVVLDLLVLADRRISLGQWDEAVLRIYRALELSMQRILQRCYGIDNSAVPLESIPATLRARLVPASKVEASSIPLGFAASAHLAAQLGSSLAARVHSKILDKQISTDARNQSWLIHGSVVAVDKTARSFRDQAHELLGVSGGLPTWPRFS